jgi:transcriptional regulator with XRE-family HTH domain
LQATTRTRTEVRVRSDRFRELAARRNETIAEVARAAHVDQVSVYRLLRGEHAPTVATRKKLLAHFGTDFDTLFVIVTREGHHAAAG